MIPVVKACFVLLPSIVLAALKLKDIRLSVLVFKDTEFFSLSLCLLFYFR